MKTTLFSLFFLFFIHYSCFSQLNKWIDKEVIPTIRGERPLKIKPYIRISHHGKTRLELGDDRLFIQIGDVKVQTHQLRLRLLQAGCILETGNIVACAPDIIEREIRKIADDPIFNGNSNKKNNPFTDCYRCLWKPKVTRDGRIGSVLVYNLSEAPVDIILWHPIYLNPIDTLHVAGNSNAAFSSVVDSDWGVEIKNDYVSICTISEVSYWDGSSWNFFVRNNTVKGSPFDW